MPAKVRASPPVQQFEVVFEDSVLGLKLSSELIVTGFADNLPSASEVRSLIRSGDKIVAVNGRSLVGMPTGRALKVIKSASIPKSLKLLSHTATTRLSGRVASTGSTESTHGAPNVFAESTGGKEVEKTSLDNESHVRILDAEVGLIDKFAFVDALFGSWANASFACQPYHVAFAEPSHACTALSEMSSSQIQGKIAIVERGRCSFLSKAWQAYQNGAVGVIVLNRDENLVAMPAESKEAAKGLNIAAVMMRKSSSDTLKTAVANGFLVQIFNHRVCSEYKNFALIEDVIHSIRTSIDIAVEVEIGADGESKGFGDPHRQGGTMVFSTSAADKIVGAASIKADFLQFLSGPRSLPDGIVRTTWASPLGACSKITTKVPRGVKGVKYFVLIERGHGCSFHDKIRNAEDAGAAGVIIVNDEEHGMMHGSSSPHEATKSEAHIIPAVMITRSAARSIKALSSSNTILFCRFIMRPKVAALWAELSSLSEVKNWPGSTKERRLLYKRLAKIHHPDKLGTGSVERFEWLRHQYRSLATNENLQ